MQYRADDESRCRPVKREGPPVSSASSSSGRAAPSAKRQKMLEMVEATDDDLLSTLSHEELKKAIRLFYSQWLREMFFFRLGHVFFVWWGDVAKVFEVHVQFCEKWWTWDGRHEASRCLLFMALIFIGIIHWKEWWHNDQINRFRETLFLYVSIHFHHFPFAPNWVISS